MSFAKLLYTVFLCGATLSSFAQSQGENVRLRSGREAAKRELQEALKDSQQHNVVSKNSLLLSDVGTAIAVAEAILFKIYQKKNIVHQRPYDSHLIDHYWVISGTLPKDWLGGTFLIIIDARDSRVIRLTHSK